MRTNVYLVRHCEVIYKEGDNVLALTEKGMQDAAKLAEKFKDYKVTKVVSSPYLRARQTIEGIASARGLDIEEVHDLRERKVSDTFIKDFLPFAIKQWEDFDYCLEGGESLNQAKARGLQAIGQLMEKHRGEDIVIGTHGALLGVLLNSYDSKYDFDFSQKLKMPDVFKLTFDGDELESIENIEI